MSMDGSCAVRHSIIAGALLQLRIRLTNCILQSRCIIEDACRHGTPKWHRTLLLFFFFEMKNVTQLVIVFTSWLIITHVNIVVMGTQSANLKIQNVIILLLRSSAGRYKYSFELDYGVSAWVPSNNTVLSW